MKKVVERFLSSSPEETRAFAARIAEKTAPGACLILRGELGAGKTVFAKGFAERFGIDPDDVLSPTFTLFRSYGESPAINHCDLYRLSSLAEAREAGILALLGKKDAVLLVEWADIIEKALPSDTAVVELSRTESENDEEREIVYYVTAE